MKVVVALNSDGHYMVELIENREGVIELLHNISDGDYFIDVVKDYGIKFKANINEYSDESWESILYTFVQRGIMEIIKIKK
jgi:hypothetical protein